MSKLFKGRPYVRPLLVALLTFVLDQVSKFFVVRFLGPAAPQHVIDLWGPVRLTYVTNTGVSFGRLKGLTPLVTMFGLLVAIGLLLAYRYLLTTNRWANLALGLVLGGAWGNMATRLLNALRYGLDSAYVVDFLDVGFWPVFNLADSAITIGGIIYGVYLVFCQAKHPPAAVKGDDRGRNEFVRDGPEGTRSETTSPEGLSRVESSMADAFGPEPVPGNKEAPPQVEDS